ncbi:hypothetical protein AAC387_Pa09g1408 [Persea americana]
MMKTRMRKREKRESVIVVLEGVKASSRDEKGLAPLSWAMRNVVHAGGDLLVLYILNPTITNGGFCCLGDGCCLPSEERKDYLKFLHEQIGQRKETFRLHLRPYYHTCKISGVKFEAKVAAGFQPKAIVKEEANNVGATCIVMDRSLVEVVNLQLRRKGRIIVLVNDNEEPEVHHPPLSKDLDIPIVRKENPNPKSPVLLREYILQEEPHIRDSLPVSLSEDKESEVHTPSMGNRLDIHKVTNEDPKPNPPKLLKEFVSSEEPHIRDSLPVQPFVPGMCCKKQIVMEPSLKENGECDSVPKTSTNDNVAWIRKMEPTVVLKLPIELSWEEILTITDGFRAWLCMSGHEQLEMYKGHLRDPMDIEVLVKRFSGDWNRIVEAEKRVSSSLSHQNFLAPICYHESSYASALVYPYTGNGTLNQYLSENSPRLTCQQRMKIAVGIGRGVRYMHEECPGGPTVHGDLRPCNIFLGRNYQPLISGFGQARWLEIEQVMMGGSKSRCWHEAPSDLNSILLIKSDVFAFGVLLLRLFCQQPMPEDDMELVDWAQPLLLRLAFHEMLDQDMEDLDMYEIYKVMSAATQCTKSKPLSRPSMTQVLSILRGENSRVMQSSPSSESSLMSHQFF